MENSNFITDIIKKDKDSNTYKEIITRFPPENSGASLHLGHLKAICLNFEIGNNLGQGCNLRFDDSNPSTTSEEYAKNIQDDIKWLGFTPRRVHYASSYFSLMMQYAIRLIHSGDAYVCDLTSDEISINRTKPTENGVESPYRNRSVQENLDLFIRMNKGEFEDGSKILRLKIDMNSPNLHMRDPIIYRIKNDKHYNLKIMNYNVYPMYDFAHCISDSIENITHSLCTLEFEVHRPLYEWILNKLDIHCPKQIEFARLNVDYTVMSKRYLRNLVESNIVVGWDDPRMLTIAGMRRRGYSKEGLFNFINKVGVTKRESITDMKLLESCIREDLNLNSDRRMAVLKPLKLTVTNYDENNVEWLYGSNNPEKENCGERQIGFSRNLWIEQDDFKIDANSKYKRMSVGRYIRLKYAYIVKCTDYNTDENGDVIEVFCEYISESKSGSGYNDIKPKGTIHFVSEVASFDADIRLYDRLFNKENPLLDEDFKDSINEDSLKILENCKIEMSVQNAKPEDRFQFERIGYFCLDKDTIKSKMVFNRTIDLKSAWK
jgi:glutaminyl-tRNA synthetase